MSAAPRSTTLTRPVDRREPDRPGAWWEHAACAGMDLDVFFPTRQSDDDYAQARAVCAGCPVRRECLVDAMDTELPSSRYGMRGGRTPVERNGGPGRGVRVSTERREQIVAQHLAGQTYRAIAKDLGLSPHTVGAVIRQHHEIGADL